MRQSALRKASHIRLSLSLLTAVLCALAFAGCGGGSGTPKTGTTGTTVENPNLAVINGTVTDTGGAPVPGAVISVVGTSLSTKTATNGTFSIINVPLTNNQITVQSPNVNTYYNIGTYNGITYGFGPTPNGQTSCAITLPSPLKPASSKTTNTLPYVIELYPGGASPPAPPPNQGCPA